jgi:quercetin dioxygenase-like cupin family protein
MSIRSTLLTGLATAVMLALRVYGTAASGAQLDARIATPQSAAKENPMTVLALQSSIEPGADKQVVSLFTGPRRTLVQITLRNGATLAAHKAPVPITIQCVVGSGTLALKDEGTSVSLTPGVLVTLEPGVAHEIVASPSVSILLTQFTDR